MASNPGNFGSHRPRKIAPMSPGAPWSQDEYERLANEARDKASALNFHAIGYGALAEGEWKAAGIPDPDLAAMRKRRLERIRAELRRRDYAGILLYDPLNIRYAADHTNMQLWTAHDASRYLFLATEGPVVLFEFQNCFHLSDHTGMVDEVRPAKSWIYMFAADNIEAAARDWAAEIADLVRTHGGGNRTIAVDHLDAEGIMALTDAGVRVRNGESVMEQARLIKGPDELICMRRAIHACEAAMHEMEAAMKPGMTENDIWALLHAGNIRRGGEWIETRLLASGPRTNPWFQESSARVVEAGDIVAFDTDLIGPYGYCCDISRTWRCGDTKPTNEQRDLYRIAAEQIAYNGELVRPGTTLLELTAKSKLPPADCRPNRYGVLFHGVGLCDEYPSVFHPEDLGAHPFDEELRPGMVLCVESYIGRLGGKEGVKLEEQLLVTETGCEQLSKYPLDERLMG